MDKSNKGGNLFLTKMHSNWKLKELVVFKQHFNQGKHKYDTLKGNEKRATIANLFHNRFLIMELIRNFSKQNRNK